MYKYVLNLVIKISLMFAQYFEYYAIILRGAGFLWTQCIYTCVSKKVPTFILSVTLSNLNRFSHILHCWKVYEIHNITHLTLGMSLHYLGKLKIQISGRV